MNRSTRDKMTSGTGTDLTTGKACWETPPAVFAQLEADFGPFDLDLTADRTRHVCPLWFGPNGVKSDALVADWRAWGSNGYSNPPYGPFVQQLLRRAASQREAGFTSTLLLPMRVTRAFKQYVIPQRTVRGAFLSAGASALLFCDRRLCFFEDGAPRINARQWAEHRRAVADAAVFDSIIVRYVPGALGLKVGLWHVPAHVGAEDLARAVARRTR